MWVRQAVWEEQVAARRAAEAVRDLHDDRADRADRRTFALHEESRNRERTLRERLIDAEATARAALARADLVTLQLNKLQDERDQLLAHALDSAHKVQIRTPAIQRTPSLHPPGVDFEDLGDDGAASAGYDIPERQDVDALTGTALDDLVGELRGAVYDPASDLGLGQGVGPAERQVGFSGDGLGEPPQ